MEWTLAARRPARPQRWTRFSAAHTRAMSAALTVAEAVERIADELGLEGLRKPKAVASAGLEQLALAPIEGDGLKDTLARICAELDIATGWGAIASKGDDGARGGGGGGDGSGGRERPEARLCLLAIGGWDSQFRRLQRVDALEWSGMGGGAPAPAWRSLPPLLAARCGAAACVGADGSVVAVGGMGEKSAEVRKHLHEPSLQLSLAALSLSHALL